MNGWNRRLPLHLRLAVVLFVLLLAVGVVNVATTLFTTRVHLEEANQRANLDLAATIASMKQSRLLGPQGEILRDGLEEIFHWMMVVNPGVQFYLLGVDGSVLAYDPMPGDAQLGRVALEPIHQLVDRPGHLPVYGDDPHDPGRRKIFSVSPIPLEGEPAGYLYVVLDDEPLDSAAARLRSSYVLRLSLWIGLGAVSLALVFGLFFFDRLTRPLRRLTRRMRDFGRWSGPEAAEFGEAGRASTGGDEVSVLAATFDEMVEKIQQQMEQIEHMAQLRSELIANVSHDLRTPIALLQGYLETLSIRSQAPDRAAEGLSPERREEYLSIALRQSRRLGKLVAELFELTKLESADAEARMEPFFLSELVQDNVQRYRLEAEERGVELRAEYDPELPQVVGDLGLIERALQNMIDNALRFTPAGGSVTVEVDDTGEGSLQVRVADTGRGIAQEDLPRVFDRSFRCRFQGADDEAAEGSGLGLAITQRIVRMHGSEMEVESEVGAGTTFGFRLQLA